MEVYVHSKNDLKKNICYYLICLIPFYLYGFYKNGYLLYSRGLINFFGMFKIFYLLGISLIIYFIIKRKINFDLLFLSMFVIPLFMSVNINYFIYIIGIFLYVFLSKYYENISIVILILSLFGSFTNKMESLNIFDYSILDMFFGRNISGIGTSNIIMSLVLLLILSFSSLYKKDVSISSLLTYILLCILFDRSLLLVGNAYFSIIIIASWSIISPLLTKGEIIYGIVIGLLGFLFMKYINMYYGMVMAIAIVSVILEVFPWVEKRFLKKTSKKLSIVFSGFNDI